ncbi:MAG TPA: DUF1552 domain-containing protein [Chthonomonadaceae bacterium]|nr:DUF1552 domain-containing protein [Chthonomonadaceae bacterium]
MGQEAWKLSRRVVLKGLGVTMCLPLLEAMGPLAAQADDKQQGRKGRPPIRMAVLYMPNGVNPHAWMPKGTGRDFELSPTLLPLAKVKSEILVLTELMNHQSLEGDGHYVKVAPFLTGTHITKTTGSELRCGGVSMDQLVAQRIGNLTPLPSLELSIEPPTTYVDTNVGYTALYGSHISWNTPTTPVSREINPQLAFDRLFRSNGAKGKGASPNDRSVLDLVADDARRLQAKVGKSDQQKLDEYFEAVRSVEKRIAFDAARRAGEIHDDPLARAEIEKLDGRIKDYYKDPANINGRKIDHTEQVRLMLDIMVLAFWTDSTRVATFMFGNEVSGKNFSFLPGVNGSHHELSHHENNPAKLEPYQKINTWFIAQYAYMLERMQAIKEGDGTLLDNAMVLFGGGMKDGNAHDPHNLPIVLGGRGGGKLATGRHLIYPKETHLCDLYRGMMACMEVSAPNFGDSDAELSGLTDPNYQGLSTPKA